MADLSRFHLHLALTKTSRSQARDRIFQVLYHNSPITKHELLSMLGNNAHKATVYRAMKRFLEVGIIQEISPGLFALTDRFNQHVHYFICRNCNRRTAFYDAGLEEAINRLSGRRHIEDHVIELTGLCGTCAQSVTPRKAIGANIRRPPGL